MEIFIGSVVKGLSKALLTKKDVYRQVYEVDLDIRKKLKLQEKMSSNTSVQSSCKFYVLEQSCLVIRIYLNPVIIMMRVCFIFSQE